MTDSIDPAAVRLGARHRTTLPQLDALAASINELGLLHPVVITPDGTLIAGARRLAAWPLTQFAGQPIPCRVVDLDEIVRGEAAENLCRVDFTLSEAVAIKRALAPLEAAKAKERQREHGGTAPGRKHSGQIAHSDAGRAGDKVAKAAGISRRTLDKAAAVMEAAESDPERFGPLVAAMDRTGRVDAPYRRLRVMLQAAALRAAPPPLPKGPYPVMAVDAPWPYEIDSEDPSHRATYDYPQMSLAEIRALPVPALAAPDCVLWLWTTNHHMRDAFALLEAWGFAHKTILTWVKDRMGQGSWLRGQTEHGLLAVRGSPVVELTTQTTVLHAPVGRHSEKPDAFYALVEGLCPCPPGGRLELFARRCRDGWVP